MHYTQYFTYHVDLLRQFKENISQDRLYQVDIDELSDNDQQFMSTLDKICAAETYSEEMSEQGQWLVGQIVNGYNHLLIAFSRDLLWFFGGSCLHFMPDQEIDFYQQLDELRFAAENQDQPFDFVIAKQFLKDKGVAPPSTTPTFTIGQ
ncbi:MAG: hypothetical protein ACI80S_000247 [Pseudohongiellaceae bacterium]|jgi:hypothetical protein